MLHPIPLPEPPAIESSQTKSDTKPKYLVETKQKHQPLVAQSLSTPNRPETFPPEFSPNVASPTKSAADLGSPLSVGQEIDRQQLAQKAEEKFSGLQQGIQVQFNSNQQLNQPSQIEFKSRNQTSQLPNFDFTPGQLPVPTPNRQKPSQITQPTPTTQPTQRIVEVTADNQIYDQQRRIITAVGHVVVRFDNALLDADSLQVSLDNLYAVGQGNVALTRGDQVLRGQRFTYNFIQDAGQLQNGGGEVYIPSASRDLAFDDLNGTTGSTTVSNNVQSGVAATGVLTEPLSDRIRRSQPLTSVSSPDGANISVGGDTGASNLPQPKRGGQVKRLRFQAGKIDFYPQGWQASDVRITNDPFSPPELQLRANKVTLTHLAPGEDRIKAQQPRLVFDRSTTIPIPRDYVNIDRRPRDVNPTLVSLGYDGTDRGGFYIERSFTPFDTSQFRWTITPQFYVQKSIQQGFSNVPSLFGVTTRLNAIISPRATLQGTGRLTSLDLNDIENNLRASLRYHQLLGDRNPYNLNLEYSYRDRLYNGTLGFQTVQSSLGGVISSPNIPLGKSGFNLRYQGGLQYIDANTDRQNLLSPTRQNDRISLARVQGSATIDGGIPLWQGKPLPPTATQGLRYTANPVVPYLRAVVGITGTSSYYTSGDNQSTITGTVGLEGQFGHFSRRYLDYTAFDVRYSQGLNSGSSPFLFDRTVDTRVLELGIVQQIWGPFRLGFQTSVNLDTGRQLSTDYILEYSRRTYGITLRYNPVLRLGAIGFRISDFNWSGGTDPFSDPSELQPVVNGVRHGY